MIGRLAILAVLLCPTAAMAGDPRIRETSYHARSVTTLLGCPGFQSTVAFGSGEHIENIALGNAALWQAVPNKRSNLLFLKPVGRSAQTNMTVVTDRHRYAFDLRAQAAAACRAGRVTYDLQFAYPDEPPTPAAQAAAPEVPAPPPPPAPESDLPAPTARNTAYSYTGASANVPIRVFDDGHSTWLRWSDGVATPAIYALGSDKGETLLNSRIKGDFVVIDSVGPAFVLRRGTAVAVLYNDGFQAPKLDADAPQPRTGKAPRHGGLARLLHGARTASSAP